MVRNYIRKTQRERPPEEILKAAIEDVVKNGFSLHCAAEKHGINYSTLRRYVLLFRRDENVPLKPRYPFQTVFTVQQEEELGVYLKTCSQMCFGVTFKALRALAYELAIKKNIKIPPSWHEHGRAGKDWALNFMKRSASLSLRSPLNRSLSRAACFNENTLRVFFDNLESIMTNNPKFADGTRIYNLDETSTTTVPSKLARVIAEKGSKEVTQIVSAERGVHVTTCCIIAANGTFLPPCFVFPRVNFKAWMLTGAPPGSLGLAHRSGWMTADNFVKVMEHFVAKSNASKENPALLIYDNAECHLSIEAINVAKNNGVTILTLPPHSSHETQPLDKTVFSPFKHYYDEALNKEMLTNPGQHITIYQIAACVGYACDHALTPANIRKGFSETGIFPMNRNIFTAADYLPAHVTTTVSGECNLETPSTSGTPSASLQDVLPPLPKRDASKTSSQRQRKKGRSFIPTNTPEKLALEASKKEGPVRKNVRKKIFEAELSEDSDVDDDLETMSLKDSSSDDETFSDLDDPVQGDDEIFDPDQIKEGDFVLFRFDCEEDGVTKFYTGQVLQILPDKKFTIKSLRMSSKVRNAFTFPNVDDISDVLPINVLRLLPVIVNTRSTKRQQRYVNFGVDFSTYTNLY